MTGPEVDLKVLQRIKKLHAMAESAKAVGSIAEAESFMEAVQKTLAAHNLEMSHLNVDLRDLEDPLIRDGYATGGVYKPKHEKWALILAQAVAEAHSTAWQFSIKGNYLWFVGRKSNVEISRKMFNYLHELGVRLGTEAYLKEEVRLYTVNGTARGASQYKWNWLQGFAGQIAVRYKAMRARLDSDRSVALVLVSVLKEAQQYSEASMDEAIYSMICWGMKRHKFKGKRTDKCPKCGAPAEIDQPEDSFREAAWRDHEAREHGKRAADSANLRPNDLDQGDGLRKMLK